MSDKTPITELKVSGHAMTLEPGLYCVSNGPDSPAPSQDGLPGVRISAAPGAQPGQVDIATFTPDGWVGADAAALIRVTGAPSSIYVTIYQEPGGTAEAPRLQVLALSAPQNSAARAPASQAPSPAAPRPGRPASRQPAQQQPAQQQPASQAPASVEALAHIYARGDVGGSLAAWIGEPGSNQWIEGFAVAPAGIPASDIEYQAVLGRGWLSPWAEGGQFCGSRGMSLPILGLRVKLCGDSARTHQVELSASFVDGSRVGPVHSGDACEAPSLAALEAFNLDIRQVQPGTTTPKTRGKATPAPVAAIVAASTVKNRKAAKPAPKPVPVPAPAPRKQAVKAAPPPPAPPPPAPKGKARGTKPTPPVPAPTRGAPAKRTPATRRR